MEIILFALLFYYLILITNFYHEQCENIVINIDVLHLHYSILN